MDNESVHVLFISYRFMTWFIGALSGAAAFKLAQGGNIALALLLLVVSLRVCRMMWIEPKTEAE
jgi:hypothetical protein